MKNLLYVLTILLISNLAYSQSRDIMSAVPTERICTYNSLIWKSEIQLQDSKIVHLRFVNEVDNTIVLRETNSKNRVLGECTSIRNELMFHISNISKSYELVTIDDCNNEVVLSVIDDSSRANFDPKSMEVSQLLSKVIKDFGFGNQKLCDVLANDNTTPLAEKISFYQKYIMKGRNFNMTFNGSCEDIIDFLVNGGFSGCGDGPSDGDDPGDGDDPVDYECHCSTLTVIANHQTKGSVVGISDYASTVGHKNVLGDNAGVKTPLSNGGKKWEYYTAKGASTWHGLYTTGWKEQNNALDTIIRSSGDFDDINTSPLRGTLVLYLLCTDGNELPSNCECDKPVTVNFTYESYLDVEAVNRDSWGNKKSRACVQDLGIAYCFQPSSKEDEGDINNIIPVAALSSSICASCEDEVNPAFWQNWRDLAGNLIDLFSDGEGHSFTWDYEYSYDSTLIKIDTLQMVPIILDSIYRVDTIVVDSTRNFNITNESQAYKDLANGVFDVLTTDHHLPRDCGPNESVHRLIENTYNTILRPNSPLTLGVMGTHRLMAGGQRSWYSHAALATNFDISVVVSPGDFSGPESDCCSPWVAGYIMGTSLPNYDELYRSNVGNDIKAYGPVFQYGNPNGFDGSGFSGYKVRGHMGFMTRYLNGVDDCVTVNEYTKLDNLAKMSSSVGISEAVLRSEKLIEQYASISIYDLSGKQIFYSKIGSENYYSNSALNNYLSKNLSNYQMGMYIVHLSDNQTNISFKHINRL